MKVILESKSAKHVQEQLCTGLECHATSMTRLRSDVFEHKGKPYLVVVDYYSKCIETSLMRDKTAGTIATHMKSIFARHGIPEELVSDNMPYNSKEFKPFASDWGFKLTNSSPTYP